MPLPLPKPENAFRVLHTADWHLGKMLGTLDRTAEHQRFLEWLGDTIVATETDALIVAGDVFDSATPPQSAVRLYFDFLASLRARCEQQGRQGQRGRPVEVVITAGNHDSPAHLEAARELLQVIGVRVVGTLPVDGNGGLDAETALIPLPSPAEPRLLVAALPFLRERDLRTGQPGRDAEAIRRELQEAIAARYAEAAMAAAPWIARGVPVLATGHLTALGAAVSESEREIHVGGLGSVGAEAFPPSLAYVALGHLHRPQAVAGRETIRYSGSPLVLSFSEAADRKEVRLLDFVGPALAAQQALPVPAPRALARLTVARGELKARLAAYQPPPGELPAWVELTVTDGSAGGGESDLLEAVREALAAAGPGRYEVIRVLSGRATAAPGLGLEEARGEQEAEALLGDPAAVFARRLDQEPGGGEGAPDRAALCMAFTELCGLLEERRRDG